MRRTSPQSRRRLAPALAESVLILIVAVFALPVYFLFSLALKSPAQIAKNPLVPPVSPHFGNFSAAWREGHMASAFLSSFVVTSASVVALVFCGSLAAYSIARRSGRLSTGIYLLFLAGLAIPLQLALVPLYQFMRDLGLLGTYWSLILADTGRYMPLAIFLYAGFLRALPVDYEEAAMVDGASYLRTFFSIVLPLMRPVTTTVVILASLDVWNEFLTPLLYLGGSGRQTITVSIYSFVNEFTSQWNIVFAALIVGSLPMMVLFFFTQKRMIRGFGSGLKG